MQHTATAWDFAPADNRLAELMKLFGCADEIAPIDAAAFGRRIGELLTRSLNSPKSTRPSKAEPANAEKASRSGQLPKSEAGFRHLLRCAPRSDRVTLAAMAAASTSLILVAATLKLLAQSEVQLMNSTVVSLQLAT